MKSVIFAAAGFVAAFGFVFGLLFFVRGSALLPFRWLSFVIPLILLTVGLTILLSGRNLNMPIDFENTVIQRGALLVWTQRFASLILLAGCFEQAMAWLRRRGPGAAPASTPWLLLAGFLAMWATSVVLPALLGAERRISHEFVYAAAIGAALLLSSHDDAQRTLRFARNALVIFMLASLALVPVAMTLVLETNYSQGLVPGLPRLAGLAPHAVSMALLALVALIVQVAVPYRNTFANLAAWALFGGELVLAQSNTIWIASILCHGEMMVVRRRPAMVRWATDPSSRSSIALAIGVVMTLVLLVGLAITAGGLAGQLMDFLSSSRGQEAMTMTGRDVNWKAALDEWERHPIFGYGPALFSPEYREYIDMAFATHGHNQFIDSLARTGLVGTTVLTVYLLFLTVESLRLAERSGGLTIALWLLLMMRSISEVPFDLYGYGPEIVPHFLLLATIAGCRTLRPEVAPAARDARVAPIIDQAMIDVAIDTAVFAPRGPAHASAQPRPSTQPNIIASLE